MVERDTYGFQCRLHGKCILNMLYLLFNIVLHSSIYVQLFIGVFVIHILCNLLLSELKSKKVKKVDAT